MWIFDVGIFVWIYFVCLLWQLIGFPFAKIFFGKLLDGGWVMGRLLSSIFISLVIFFISSISIPFNTNLGLILSALGLACFSFVIWKKRKFRLKVFLMEKWRIVLAEELLFFGGIVFMGTMRGFWPNLDSLEKYMDFGFIYQYLIQTTLPITDMWFAGEPINYYSFGHFWSSILIRSWGVEPTVGFNLMLAFSFGLNLALAFAIVVNLLKKSSPIKRLLGGIVSASLVMFGGNGHILWFMTLNKGLLEGDTPYWYALATRFIDQTIHEFPSYTFSIGDLHAHLIDLPTILSFLLVFLQWSKTIKEKLSDIYLEIIMGVLLGVMVMTNTWDSLIYGFLLFVYSVFRMLFSKTNFRVYIKGALVVAGVAILISSPWWWNFKQMTHGIVLVDKGSPLWQIGVLWSCHVLFGVVAWLIFKKNIAARSIVVTSLILIAIPEIFYFKDIYDNFPRANTMFKLTYQAFVMLSLLGGVVIAKTANKNTWIISLFMSIVSVGLLIYPFTSYPNFYNGFKTYQGLDGEKWLADSVSDKYGAILYLKKYRDDKTLLEYPGKSFSLSNATPVFSGVPVILGWRDHEWLWRSNIEEVEDRTNEIREVYENPQGKRSEEIIKEYNLGWIIVGKEERENYEIEEERLLRLGEIVWKDKESLLIKINRSY